MPGVEGWGVSLGFDGRRRDWVVLGCDFGKERKDELTGFCMTGTCLGIWCMLHGMRDWCRSVGYVTRVREGKESSAEKKSAYLLMHL